MILVTGATGNAGSAVVRALASAGEQVRALVRDANPAPLPARVDAVVGDLNEPDTLAPHLDGVTTAFVLSGYERLQETLANMRRAGVERVEQRRSQRRPYQHSCPLPHPLRAGRAGVGPRLDIPPAEHLHDEHPPMAAAARRAPR